MPIERIEHDYYTPPDYRYICDHCGCVVDEDELPDYDGDDVYCPECWDEKMEEEKEEEEDD